ncbi:protein kinase [Nonomuraea sp. NPDC059194]|uniref:serine/threonine-protein kinase n=1 Tax=Nonomuraea sp. NPDC059194 TaxID=3346764 RepID=UPI0036805B33
MGEPSEQRLVGGRYLLADEVGRGGMGIVWRAHDQVLDRPVALKQVLVPGWMGEQDRARAFQRVLREARAAARLRNPYVITIHDVVMDDGHPWIVMELLRASSLAQVLERTGPLPEQAAADIGAKVLEALRTAHAAGITHRDVKPANVLLLDDGGVVLTDFGIAHVADSPTLTATGKLMGSPAYMAPERLEGAPASEASDLWALGATLYTAVEGVPPYPLDSPVAILAAILMREPRPMRLAVRLEGVVLGLLRKDPGERLSHESAAAVLGRVAARSGEEPRRRAGSRALAALVRDQQPDVPSDPEVRSDPGVRSDPDAPTEPVPSGPDVRLEPHAPSAPDTPAAPDARENPDADAPTNPGPSRPATSLDVSDPATGHDLSGPATPHDLSGPGSSPDVSGPATPRNPSGTAAPAERAGAPSGSFRAGLPPRGGGSARTEAAKRMAHLLRVAAVVVATAGVVAYAAPRAVMRMGIELPSIEAEVTLLVLFGAFAVLAAVLPGGLLPQGGAAATVTRALPFVAFAGYLGGYQAGSGSQMTTAMAYGLLCAWAAVTAVRTWRRSRTAAAVAAAAVVCFAALAVTHLWIDVAGPDGLASAVVAVANVATAAAWALVTMWGWWAACRTR